MPSKRTTRIAALGMTALLAASGLAACSSDGSASTTPTTAADAGSSTTVAQAMTGLAAANFGPGCAAVPATGAGSFDGMATAPAATAASANPALSTLVEAVTAASLADTLNGEGPFTIFAPTNDAFAKIPADTMSAVLADPTGKLADILTYHVVAGESLNAEQLAAKGEVTTVEGATIKVAEKGDTIELNGQSAVVCGNVKVGNGTVQIIDTVLMPPTS
jgi:uncharacterized surface protein with fasciclin (FAS1) repeats